MHALLYSGRQALLASTLAALAIQTEAAFAQSSARSDADEIRIVDLRGIVEVLPQGASTWVKTQTNQVLYPFDRLRTRSNSRVTLRWSAQSVVPLDALTEIEILPHPPEDEPGLHLIGGLSSFFHRDKPGRIRIITHGAVAGVEGTEFVINVDDSDQTTLWLIDGRVRFTANQIGVVITNGQKIVAAPGKPPVVTAGFIANNILQWCFYYPAVLDLRDLPLAPAETQALDASLAAYRSGGLLQALAKYPDARQPASDAERVYYAALLLSVGQVEQSENTLATLSETNAAERVSRLATALRQLIAAVKLQPTPLATQTGATEGQLSTELLAASYYQQSLAVRDVSLIAALNLARQAAAISPDSGFAWARVAELEFSFGRTRIALDALNKSLALAPRNAQAIALKGFLLAAQNKTRDAIETFDEAIAIDSALGNAWLGRGLCRIRRGDLADGREDLLIAAALEPQRALLRSYLGKAYGDAGDFKRAEKELQLAKDLDPNDPTAWLYSALLNEQHNRFNEAIADLERSQELNENRSVYRSGLLLDQDRAVRSANLARIYDEAGLDDVALHEASRASAADYGNFSAHLFLANSYNGLINGPFDLRFAPSALSEYLIASLLGPADGRILAQPVAQQEYTRLFDRDTLGLSTSTEYLSRGAWNQYGAQYGTIGSSSYAVEGNYLTDPGQTPDGRLESWYTSIKAKQMLTLHDGLFFQLVYGHTTSGDLNQRYDPGLAIRDFELREKQGPNVLGGLDHQWSESQRTLLLVSHFSSSIDLTNPHSPVMLETQSFGVSDGFSQQDLSQKYHNTLSVNSVELQHLMLTGPFQTIVGTRFQFTTESLSSVQFLEAGNSPGYEIYFGNLGDLIANQSLEADAVRISPYLYEYWQVARPLLLIGGLSYDYQSLPHNTRFAPLNKEDEIQRRLSPKAGLVWTPTARAAVRGAYSKSLGGFNLEQDVRLEPTQLAGFPVVYRNPIPSSLVGGVVSGDHLETGDVSLEYRFPSRTYIAAAAQLLHSTLDDHVGGFQRDLFTSQGPALQFHRKLSFQERSLDFSAHQLLGDWFSLGARYRLSEARLTQSFPDVDPSLGNTSITDKGLLHTVKLEALAQHPSGFFAGAQAVWWSQALSADLAGVAGDSLWQENLVAGYRFPRRHAEIRVGILNLGDANYRLHPINLYPDLPRSRTFFVRLQLNY